MLIHIYKCILLGNMPRAKHVVNTDYVGNDQEDIPIAQLRKERRKKRVRTPSPQPMEAEVHDEVEFEGDYGQTFGCEQTDHLLRDCPNKRWSKPGASVPQPKQAPICL
jgi:hypothetical protein